MNATDLINLIVDKASTRQDRIEAIGQLGARRSHEKQHREGRAEGIADHLGVDELPGQIELRQVVQDSYDHLDVRCQAAAVAAKTDNKAALEWCNELIEQYI
jgi:hypothetical protein